MAPSNDDLGASLADLERELDLEEYSLLTAPPPRPPSGRAASSRASATPALLSSQRGESITPSSARASPRGFQGGLVGDLEETVQSPSALGVGALRCVFIGSYDVDRLCLGRIGTSDRACAAAKLDDQDHCGIKDHGRNKAVVEADAFYAPTGTTRGKSTFKTDPYVKKAHVSAAMMPLFLTGLFKTMEWVHHIVDAAIPTPILELDLKPSASDEDESSKRSVDFSTISALAPFGSASIKFERVDTGDEILDDAIWQDTAKKQQVSLNELGSMLNRVGEQFPELYRKVNVEHRSLLNRVKDDIKELRQEREKLDAMLGDFASLTRVHGSAAEAVHEVFVGLNTQQSDISTATSDRESIRESLSVHIKRLEADARTMFRVIKKVARTSNSQVKVLEQRLLAVEQIGLRIETEPRDFLGDDAAALIDDIYGSQPSLPRVQQRATAFAQTSDTAVDGHTSFGQVEVGGASIELTMNTLFSMFKDLEAKLQVGLDRSEGQGIIFHDLAFPSEIEFDQFYSPLNSVGRGSAAFVDIVSAWAFASLEQISTAEWLQMKHRATATGLGTNVEAQYITTMQNKYPVPFVGAVETVLATDTIKCFQDLKTWQGNGLGDGGKERLVSALRVGIARHKRYCLDNLPKGVLRDHAIKSGEFSLDFFQAFVSHVDDEVKMLITLGLKEKQVMLLVSSQLIQICDDLFELRQDAANVDTSNKGLTAVRFAWVTLRSLNKMAEYLQDKFKNVFAGTFVRFLTTQIADINPAGSWKEKATAMDTKITAMGNRLTKVNNEAASKDSLHRVDTKLESLIRLNNLKKNGNARQRRGNQDEDGIEEIP